MARTKRVPMHFPYQGPQPEAPDSQDPAQVPISSENDFFQELTTMACGSEIEPYQHPLYLSFLADHAPGINTANPQMGTEKLTVDRLTRLLFAAIPNGFREESIEFENPFMTKDGEYPIEYRHPDFLQRKEEDDPKFQDLLELMLGLEAGLLKVRDAVEAAIAIYTSDQHVPGLQERLYNVQSVIKSTWVQLGQRLRKLTEYESIWADKLLDFSNEESSPRVRRRRSSRLTEMSDDDDEKNYCYCQLFAQANSSHIAGETGKFVGPQILYGTEKYLRALDQGIKGSYAAFQIATTIKADLGVSTWMHHRTRTPTYFANLYAHKALPRLRIFFKITQIRDWECRDGIGGDPADEIMAKMEAGEISSDESNEDTKAIKDEVRKKIASKRRKQSGNPLSQEEADAILQHKISLGLRVNPESRVRPNHNRKVKAQPIQEMDGAAPELVEESGEDSHGETREEVIEQTTSSPTDGSRTVSSFTQYSTPQSNQWLTGRKMVEGMSDTIPETESEDDSGEETEEYLPPQRRRTTMASKNGKRPTPIKGPQSSKSSKSRGRGRPVGSRKSLDQAKHQAKARTVLQSSSSDIDGAVKSKDDTDADTSDEDEVKVGICHDVVEEIADDDHKQ
ncbi:hypothetical protein BP5796_02484 [Coleophoma crateriformis]|uniref:Uncharacterized protein n=1 Tax=Coleophoma crateriformis TaxID=565419 RepID=A0A3D8SYI6_9HELO|nr:hypothetical protein BP5796_02484 [Coleophoma crateriformis]